MPCLLDIHEKQAKRVRRRRSRTYATPVPASKEYVVNICIHYMPPDRIPRDGPYHADRKLCLLDAELDK